MSYKIFRPPGDTDRKESLLGDWNSEYNDFSKTVALDGLEAFIGKLPANERIAKEENFPKVSKDMKAFKRLSDYDKFNLRLLYCSELKAGMDRYEVMRVLSTAEQCWAFDKAADM